MSERERVYQLLDTVPDSKISYLIGYIQGLTVENEEIPNSDTLAAFKEGDEMLANGTGKRYTNTTDLFADLED
ncbi:hypothetical protein C823_006177 [Eubacterium plexicaudatum ASF492]|jgi:hypothetical protein|uniref:RelB/DinJ family addiction module antitoxin n=1 Tax=Eubacterium plexicaudatum ASF492 TaxID=1235802 RepID=N2AL89_9FIRM|nr:hypothetical protein C823_006177 [Eubacterium plexicaudatum ASF492]